jgi:hypothetical protein
VQTLTNINVDQTIVVEEEFVPLPVELEKFTAHLYEKDKVKLEWHTLTEINNDRFEIERSRNGNDFRTLSEIKAGSNPSEEQFYQYVDESPFEGVNYYRLKQIDFDGKFDYGPIRSVALKFSGFEFKIYPNPISQKELFIRYATKFNHPIFEIYDSNGELRHRKVMESDHSDVFKTDIGGLPAGLYFIKMTANQEVQTRKLVVY